MIEFKNVSYTYYSKFYSLYNFNYSFKQGNYALIGEDIEGPLTVIRLLAKLDSFYKGEIIIDNKSLKKINYKKDFNVAYISANPKFFNNKTVLENVVYPLKSRGVKKSERNQIGLSCLKNFNWENMANIKVSSLSQQDLITLSFIRASTRPLNLLLCENLSQIFKDNCEYYINIINKIPACIKIVVSISPIPNYTPLNFYLGSLKLE